MIEKPPLSVDLVKEHLKKGPVPLDKDGSTLRKEKQKKLIEEDHHKGTGSFEPVKTNDSDVKSLTPFKEALPPGLEKLYGVTVS